LLIKGSELLLWNISTGVHIMSNCKKMSRSEAGRLGGFASADYQHTQRQQRVDEYKKILRGVYFVKKLLLIKRGTISFATNLAPHLIII